MDKAIITTICPVANPTLGGAGSCNLRSVAAGGLSHRILLLIAPSSPPPRRIPSQTNHISFVTKGFLHSFMQRIRVISDCGI